MTSKQNIDRSAQLSGARHSYENGLVKHAFFKTNYQTLSDNLSQDTFMKTWQYLAKGGKIIIMKAFLYHIMNNLIVDEYRKRGTTSLDVLLEQGFEPSTDDASDIFNLLDGKTAMLLIGRLPITYQRTMHLRYTENMSLSEISFATKQTKNTVAVQIHRGLEKMRLLCAPAHA